MGEHVVLNMDDIVKTETVEPIPAVEVCSASLGSDGGEEEQMVSEEEEPLIKPVECRICHEEEVVKNLEIPCVCSGSLKYAHRICVQRWCNEKGDTNCEICQEPYRPGYTAPPRAPSDETIIDVVDGWMITGRPVDVHEARILARTAAERQAECDEYLATNARRLVLYCSVALILISLPLMWQHVLISTYVGVDGYVFAIFSRCLMWAAVFLMACDIMAWAVSMLRHQRQRQGPDDLLAARLLFLLHSGYEGADVVVESLAFLLHPDQEDATNCNLTSGSP